MPPCAFRSVILSTLAHALWNLLGKRHNPSAALFPAASLAAIAVCSPALILFGHGMTAMPKPGRELLVATGLTQAIYYRALTNAHRHGDPSMPYPPARALPVMLVALPSLTLGRAQHSGAPALPSFLLITLGCLTLPSNCSADRRLQAYRQPALRAALLAALCIAAYMLIDARALRLLRSLPVSALSSLEWALLWVERETAGLSLALPVVVLCCAPERRELQRLMRAEWRSALTLGTVITGTYVLVLWAMAFARDVSSISAFRQLSIPIGAG